MTAVWKFPLDPLNDLVDLTMPAGAEVLFVGVQFEIPMLWARVRTDAPVERRRFRVAGTGHLLSGQDVGYVGSFMLRHGVLVFHVFEEVAGPVPAGTLPMNSLHRRHSWATASGAQKWRA